MKTKKLLHKILYVVAAFLLSLFVVFEYTLSKAVTASAETQKEYSDVMDDLHKDESFNEEDFPVVATDYSLEVFQIAESLDRELFIYVYQPSHSTKDLVATSINISTEIEDDLAPVNYELELLSTYGVFDKYKVLDFKVKTDTVRYYEIVSIYRAFDEDIDIEDDFDFENKVSEVALEIGDLWSVMTTSTGVVYAREKADVIFVKTQIVGYISYDEGFFFDGLSYGQCQSFFVAFSTDRTIDELYEASLSFTSELFTADVGVFEIDKIDEKMVSHGKKKETVDLSYTDVASNDGSGWWGKKYEWTRIESSFDFVKSNSEDLNLTKGNVDDLEKTQWILRFTERAYGFRQTAFDNYHCEATVISDVSILRLKFRTGTNTYNLGVVSNKQSGGEFAEADDKLDDFIESFTDTMSYVGAALIVVIVVVGVIFLIIYAEPVFKVIWKVICFPFKMIGKFFRWLGGLFKRKK